MRREVATIVMLSVVTGVFALVVMAVRGADPLSRFASVDIAERRVTVHDLVSDDWTVCVDDMGTQCHTVGELRALSLFQLPEVP